MATSDAILFLEKTNKRTKVSDNKIFLSIYIYIYIYIHYSNVFRSCTHLSNITLAYPIFDIIFPHNGGLMAFFQKSVPYV